MRKRRPTPDPLHLNLEKLLHLYTPPISVHQSVAVPKQTLRDMPPSTKSGRNLFRDEGSEDVLEKILLLLEAEALIACARVSDKQALTADSCSELIWLTF
jgi:hypothetical protein